MQAGTLRHRITFQTPSADLDALNQPVGNWLDFAVDVRAAVEPLTGAQRFAAQAQRPELTHTVTIRYQKKFADPLAMATMRIAYGQRIFTIKDVIDMSETHRSLVLQCAEGLNNG